MCSNVIQHTMILILTSRIWKGGGEKKGMWKHASKEQGEKNQKNCRLIDLRSPYGLRWSQLLVIQLQQRSNSFPGVRTYCKGRGESLFFWHGSYRINKSQHWGVTLFKPLDVCLITCFPGTCLRKKNHQEKATGSTENTGISRWSLEEKNRTQMRLSFSIPPRTGRRNREPLECDCFLWYLKCIRAPVKATAFTAQAPPNSVICKLPALFRVFTLIFL